MVLTDKIKQSNFSVLNTFSDFIVVLDNLKRVVFINDNFLYYFEAGNKKIRIIGEDYLGLCDNSMNVTRNQVDDIDVGVQNVLDGSLEAFSTEYKCKLNQTNWFQLQVKPFRVDTENYVVLSHKDISKVKSIENTLKENNDRLNLAVAGANIGLWDWEIMSGQVAISGQLIKILGYNSTELEENIEFWKTLIHPDDKECVLKDIEAHLQNKTKFFESEHRLKSKSGEWKWFYTKGRVLPDNLKGSMRLLCIYQDVSKRKKAENQLAESESKYRHLFNEIKDAIYICSIDGRLIDINQAGVDMFGYTSAEDLIGVDFSEKVYVNNSDHDSIRKLLLKNSFVRDYELKLKVNDDQVIEALTSVSISNDHEVPLVCGVLKDITEMKKIEHHMAQVDKLEAIATLAGGLAHDFNNMLGVVAGYSELLKLNLKENKNIEMVNHISCAGQRAKELVDQLNTFSIPEIQKKPTVKISEAINETLNFLKVSIPKKINIISELNMNGDVVSADRSEISRILMNLGINAFHAIENKGDTITIKLEKENISDLSHEILQKGTYAKLQVSDNGCGICDDNVKRIFDPFFSTKKISKGTGMGLSVVYGIVKKLNGTIKVESEEGKGSSFSVYLPLAMN